VGHLHENNTIVQGTGAQPALSILDGSTGTRVRDNILVGGAGSFHIDGRSYGGLSGDWNVVSGPAGAGYDRHSIVNATPASAAANHGIAGVSASIRRRVRL